MNVTSLARQDVKKITLLGNLSEALLSTQSVSDFHHASLQILLDFIPADRVDLYCYRDTKRHFRLIRSLCPGSAPSGDRGTAVLAASETVFARLIEKPAPISRNQIPEKHSMSPGEATVFLPQLAADLILPVIGREKQLVGVLHFARKTPIRFNSSQRHLAAAGADFLGLMLEDECTDEPAHERQWEAKFFALFAGTPLPCCLVDGRTWTILRGNRQAREYLLGSPDTELSGTSILTLADERYRDRFSSWLQSVATTRRPPVLRLLLRLPEGAARLCRVHALYLDKNEGWVFVYLVPEKRDRREKHRWQRLYQILALWQSAVPEAGTDMPLENGLQRLAQSLGAKYVALLGREEKRMTPLALIERNKRPPTPQSRAKLLALTLPAGVENTLSEKLIYCPDVLRDPKFKAWQPGAKQLGFSGLLILPIQCRTRFKGAVLLVYFESLKRLRRKDLAWLRIAAISLAQFLERVYSQRRLAAVQKQRTAMESIARHLNRAILEPCRLVEAAGSELYKILPFDFFSLALFESELEDVQLFRLATEAVSRKFGRPDWQPVGPDAPLGWLDAPAAPAQSKDITEPIFASRLTTVLVSRKKYLGLLEIARQHGETFSDEQKAFFELIAGQLAVAIENALLFEKLKRQVKESAMLARTSWALTGEKDLQSILSHSLRSLQKILGLEEAAYYAIQATGDIPTPVVVGNGTRTTKWHLSQEVIDMINSARAPIVLDEPARRRSTTATGSLLLCPVHVQRRLTGVIALFAAAPRHFSRRESELVRTLANLIATAISQHRMRQEEREHARELEHSNEQLEKFVYTVSHDLKSPVVSIQGFVSILLDDFAGELPGDAVHYLNRIQKNAQAMEQLIKDLFELSRLDKTSAPKENIPARRLIDRALMEFSFQIQAFGIEITIQEDLPEIYANETQLTRVFANLIGNAVKYRDQQKSPPKIIIGAQQRGKEVVFWIQDNGIGIAEDLHSRIFDLFERGRGQHEIEGTGIGLTIARRILENHGGRIWVDSTVGEGTTFYFSLPASEA